MPIIPARPMVLALLVPTALALATALEPGLLLFVLLIDAALLLVFLFDLAFVRGQDVTVVRKVTHTLSLARPVTVSLEVQNRARRRLQVTIADALFSAAETDGAPVTMSVDAGKTRHSGYRLRALERGMQVIGDHHVRYNSPIGFWTRQFVVPAQDVLRVYPDVQAVRHYEMLARQNRDHFASRLTRMRGGDTEFERLRDYLPDDEFKKVDWKATARRRKLTVREYQLEKNQNVVFMLDCGRTMTATWDGLTALDYALNAVLMLSHVAVRRGDQVGMIAFDEKVTRLVKPRGGVSASNHLIQSSYDLFPKMVEPDYETAFKTLRRHIRKRTLVVFISHALDDVTAKRFRRLTRELLPRHLPLCVLLKDANVEAKANTLATGNEEVCVQAAAAEILLWRDRVKTEMERSGVLVLDTLHKHLTGALVSRYLEVKAAGLI